MWKHAGNQKEAGHAYTGLSKVPRASTRRSDTEVGMSAQFAEDLVLESTAGLRYCRCEGIYGNVRALYFSDYENYGDSTVNRSRRRSDADRARHNC